MNTYRTRLVEKLIASKMRYSGAVVIEGPKWCGKSTTAMRFSRTVVKLQDPNTKRRYQALATISMDSLLQGEKPVLFDEWQEVPELWDFIRLDVDEHQLLGAYLLTGSAKKNAYNSSHTGTGRINHIYMRPMSLYESHESNGTISLAKLFEKGEITAQESLVTIEKIAHYICRGGWPQSLDLLKEDQLLVPRDLLESTIAKDIDEIGGIAKNRSKMRRLIQSYARNISTLATNKTIYSDQSNDDSVIDPKTFDRYVDYLEKLFIIENVPAWSPRIRSSIPLRTSAKKQFVDPSMAIAALGITPQKLLTDFETFGFFFESIVTRDIRIYSDLINGHVFYYQDSHGLEVDLIIELDDGRWGAIEVKLGENEVEKAATNLLKVAQKVVGTQPTFLMVVTNTRYAYKRTDGVIVVPLGCLRD